MTILSRAQQKKIRTLRQLIDALTSMVQDASLTADERIKAAQEARLDLEFICKLDLPMDTPAANTHDYQ